MQIILKSYLNDDCNVTWVTDIKAKNQTIMSMAQTIWYSLYDSLYDINYIV